MLRFTRTPNLDELDGIDDGMVEAAFALREAIEAGDARRVQVIGADLAATGESMQAVAAGRPL